MTRRNPREGLRDRWVRAVLASEVGNACKVLLILLAYRMNTEGKVSIPRAELAELLRVHPSRVSERIAEAKAAGLLDHVGGSGHRGTVAQYVAVMPTQCLPASGNQPAGMVTGGRLPGIGNLSPGPEGDCLPVSGNHNARALRSERKPRENTAGYSRTTSAPKDSSDEDEPRRPSLAAVLPDRIKGAR